MSDSRRAKEGPGSGQGSDDEKDPGRDRKTLGIGGVSDQEIALAHARNALLEAIRTETPHVMEALAKVAADDDDAVQRWATGFNLNSPWCKEIAAFTLRVWQQSPSLCSKRLWGKVLTPPYRKSGVPGQRLIDFRIIGLGWSPDLETRYDARTRLCQQFDLEVERYLDGVGAQLPDGYEPTRTKTARHFRWTALYLCGERGDGAYGWSYRQLADHMSSEQHSVSDSTSTVRDAIKDVMRLVDLPMPQRPGGRPRGSSRNGADS